MRFFKTLKGIAGDMLRLFYPPVCPVCGDSMPEEAGFMCTRCRYDMPLTGYWEKSENPVRDKFAGHLLVREACGFFHYMHDSPYRSLVHSFKYAGGWKGARDMGEWFGNCLAESGRYDGIDIIVPVPLHRRKFLKRGYNQSAYIAEGLSRAMGIPVCTGNLVRTRHSKSQTKVKGRDRWNNVYGAFSVRDPEEFRGKHILLVDDVLTTGATIIACGEELLRSAEDMRLSIVTLGVAGFIAKT